MIRYVPLEMDFDESVVPIKYCQNSSASSTFEIYRERKLFAVALIKMRHYQGKKKKKISRKNESQIQQSVMKCA